MNNSYQRIKDHINNMLSQAAQPLAENEIANRILNVKETITKFGYDLLSNLLPSNAPLTPLSEIEWERMKRELEMKFDVKMESGFLISASNNPDRDPYWWSSKFKQSTESYYWKRYKTLLNKTLTHTIVNAIETDTDVLMDNLENPLENRFSRYGMVVGHVQSGKTSNYSALVCKAADAGYNFIVVIAGGINNLRNQTQERLNESFVGRNINHPVGVGIGDTNRQKLPISLTTASKDFNKQDADTNSQGINFDNINVPILIVIKKNTKTLKNVINWLKKQYQNKISKHSMLIIDDESDYASINTNEETDPTKINEQIRKLIISFEKGVYVAYTATPYANIFIDHAVGHTTLGKDLFPKDFIYALDAPTDYFGANKIFLKKETDEEDSKHIINIDDYSKLIPEKHKNTINILGLPESLKDAIRHFLINISIRHLKGQSEKHNSMLVHVSRFTNVHVQMTSLITNYLNILKENIETYGALSQACNHSEKINDLMKTYVLRIIVKEFNWDDILRKLTTIIDTILVRGVHVGAQIPLVYRKDISTNVIVVGGTSLSRGYTLEGLSISYFLRNSVYYDTLMQMGRWFGYRHGYEELCKIYLPEKISNNFALIIEATNDLMGDFKRMSEQKMTPQEFGLAVKYNPDSALQVTARNKQKNTSEFYLEMKLDGHTKETVRLFKNEENTKNLIVVNNLLNNALQKNEILKIKNNYLIQNIDKSHILKFLNDFKFYNYNDEFGFKSRMPLKFIKQYVNDINTSWDVSIHSGTGDEINLLSNGQNIVIKKETRKLEDMGEYRELSHRKVASGNAEVIALDEQQLSELEENYTSKSIANILKRPLLMLHILQNNKEPDSTTYPAYGICFPGGVATGTDKVIKLKINTVYLKNLEQLQLDSLEEESSDEE